MNILKKLFGRRRARIARGPIHTAKLICSEPSQQTQPRKFQPHDETGDRCPACGFIGPADFIRLHGMCPPCEEDAEGRGTLGTVVAVFVGLLLAAAPAAVADSSVVEIDLRAATMVEQWDRIETLARVGVVRSPTVYVLTEDEGGAVENAIYLMGVAVSENRARCPEGINGGYCWYLAEFQFYAREGAKIMYRADPDLDRLEDDLDLIRAFDRNLRFSEPPSEER